MLAKGEQPTTLSGRRCSPFPKVDCTTNRRAIFTLKRVEEWLIANAIEEANYKKDEYCGRMFENTNIKNLSQADKDAMNIYLFGVAT